MKLMELDLTCLYCITKKADHLYDLHVSNGTDKLEYIKEIYSTISNTKPGASSPQVTSEVMNTLKKRIDIDAYYQPLKDRSNEFMLSVEDEIREQIKHAEDPLFRAVKYAMVGNFIDFGAMDAVDKATLQKIIDQSDQQAISKEEYAHFKRECLQAKNLVYLTDNAGEIVFDKLLIEQLKQDFPHLTIHTIVRGMPVYNDATFDDAHAVGLTAVTKIYSNGTDMPGTELDEISDQTRSLIDESDLILAKGQGNFESLFGCGKNIYYLFLCKCDLFASRFGLEKYSGVFANEKRLTLGTTS
ncbi:MAG TPA: hypothetical protein DHN33_04930 [Eubacteriaceae bacterium]|nr:hypothetical protein [Eubacteriaceae bacterium]